MGITVIWGLTGYHLSNWQGKCVYTVRPIFVTASHKWQPPIRGYFRVQNTKLFSSHILIIRTSYKQPPLMLFREQLCWERLLEKMRTQQSQKVIQSTPDNSNQNRFPLDFRHTFTVILPSVTRTLDNSNSR